jgi:hypothetical protein
MKKILWGLLAVFTGLLCGSMINMGIVLWGPKLIPPPPGADVSSIEGLKASLPLFEARHFIMPFLAHAMGTFSGALIAALFSGPALRRAMLLSLVFFAGGLMNVRMLPAPLWFNITDLVLAYFPMGFAAFLLLKKLRKQS